jgi:ATP-dependent protease HslVU (ClpYQ) peptidase subunit
VTVIAGLVHNGRVWLGADTASSTGDFVLGAVKAWEQGDFIFAFTGCTREQQIIQHRVTLPAMVEGVDVLHYLVVDFTDAVRQARKDAGYHELHASGSEKAPTLLIGYEDRLFVMHCDYAVSEHHDFATHGSGMEAAYGSLHTSAAIWRSPEKRIKAALAAACASNIYCRAPFTVLHT